MFPAFAELPEPLTAVYGTPEVNEPVPLYRGPVELSADGKMHRKDAEIRLAWLPAPLVELRVDDFFSTRLIGTDDEWRVYVPGRSTAMPVIWTRATPSVPGSGEQGNAVGRTFEEGQLAAARVRYVDFHLANAPAYIGHSVRYGHGGLRSARALAESGAWRVTLDAIHDWTVNEKRRRLRESGGYAITHVGRLERADGQPFEGGDATAPLDAFGWLVSFCRGAWSFPMLLVAEDADTGERYEVWRCPRIDADARHRSWFNELSIEGFGAYPGVVAKLADSTWNEPVRHALHWYIVCNKPGPVSIEGAIVLQQAAFELLAWTLLVEERKVLSDDGAQKLPASDRIRLMLSTCGIPLGIPSDLDDLLKVAKAENWQDGPHATTEIRNALVHASPKKRARIFGHGHGPRTDAWTLGQWYLELILLRLFDYTGHYSNRLRRGAWQGTEVEPVPWAK